MIPIYIPTKGRALTAKTPHHFPEAVLVIEQEDYAAYKKAFPEHALKILPASNQGIAYVRNYIKQYTEDHNVHRYWMLDDDISGFFHRVGTKMMKLNPVPVLNEAESQLASTRCAQGALGYQQIEWSSAKPLSTNSYCDVAVYIDNTQTFGMRYDPHVEGKEDRDFTMQIIAAGKTTARSSLYCFGAPANGSNDGGLKESFYAVQGREEVCADRMVTKWPHCVEKITKPNGRVDAKITWKNIYKQESNLFNL